MTDKEAHKIHTLSESFRKIIHEEFGDDMLQTVTSAIAIRWIGLSVGFNVQVENQDLNGELDEVGKLVRHATEMAIKCGEGFQQGIVQ